MLTIKLEIESNITEDKIDSFTRGHITIRGNGFTLSSKDRVPDQSMMIFFSIAQLISEVKMFMNNQESKKYNFVGTDSSFQFFLIKKEKCFLLTEIKNNKIYEGSQSRIVASIWRGVKDFILEFGDYLDNDEIIVNDLNSSMEEFREEFKLSKL